MTIAQTSPGVATAEPNLFWQRLRRNRSAMVSAVDP